MHVCRNVAAVGLDEPLDPETHPEGPIEPNKDEVPDKGIGLPRGFVWSSVDLLDEAQVRMRGRVCRVVFHCGFHSLLVSA